MRKLTKWAAALTAGLALIAGLTIAWMAGIPSERVPPQMTRDAIAATWKAALSLILIIWVTWGLIRRHRAAPAQPTANPPAKGARMSRRTKTIAWTVSAALVVAMILILSLHGNGPDVTAEDVRVFTGYVAYPTMACIAATWLIAFWITKQQKP